MSAAEQVLKRDGSIPWTKLFLVIACLFGTIYVFATPILSGTDEPAHVARLALISDGHVLPSTQDPVPSDYSIDGCLSVYVNNYRLLLLAEERRDWSDQFKNLPCSQATKDLALTSRTADVYSPVPYAPALVGFRFGRAIGGASGSLLGARLAQLGAYIALVAYALRKIPWGRPLIFTIGLLPVSLQGAAGISADPMTLALALLSVALTLNAIDPRRTEPVSRNFLILLGSVIVTLALCKSAYIPFVLLVFAIPTAAYGTLRRRALSAGTTFGIAGILAGAWNLGVVAHINIVGVNGSDSVVAAKWIREHPRGFLGGIKHGWLNVTERTSVISGLFAPFHRWSKNFPLPNSLGLLWLVAARLASPKPGFLIRARTQRPSESTAVDKQTRYLGIAVASVIALATFILIEYGLAIAANPPGTEHIIWVQGRYFLPLLPLTLFGASGNGHARARKWQWVFPILSVGVLSWWTWWMSTTMWKWL